MSYSKRVPFVFAAAISLVPMCLTFGQRNNPYSANPDTRTTVATVRRPEPQSVDVRSQQRVPIEKPERATDLTQIYKIGAGDTLYIVLTNAPNASGYYSVRADGTIDFPLAADSPNVLGRTADEIAQMLSPEIKIYRDARLQVKVQEFGSHKISVSGLVERNGERFLQREVMPLFTIKAAVGVHPDATMVIIRRSSGASEIYKLTDVRTDDVLIHAGDTIDFEK